MRGMQADFPVIPGKNQPRMAFLFQRPLGPPAKAALPPEAQRHHVDLGRIAAARGRFHMFHFGEIRFSSFSSSPVAPPCSTLQMKTPFGARTSLAKA